MHNHLGHPVNCYNILAAERLALPGFPLRVMKSREIFTDYGGCNISQGCADGLGTGRITNVLSNGIVLLLWPWVYLSQIKIPMVYGRLAHFCATVQCIGQNDSPSAVDSHLQTYPCLERHLRGHGTLPGTLACMSDSRIARSLTPVSPICEMVSFCKHKRNCATY